jgi:hypothetical protein
MNYERLSLWSELPETDFTQNLNLDQISSEIPSSVNKQSPSLRWFQPNINSL